MFQYGGELNLNSVNLNVKSKSQWLNECHAEYFGNMLMHNQDSIVDSAAAGKIKRVVLAAARAAL